jgi:choline transport protein
MSEEIENAEMNVPRVIFATMILNGATGYAMLLAVLFCLEDVDGVLVSRYLTTSFSPSNNCSEHCNRLPLHPGFLQCYSILCGNNHHDELDDWTRLLHRDWVSSHCIACDLVLCARPGTARASPYCKSKSQSPQRSFTLVASDLFNNHSPTQVWRRFSIPGIAIVVVTVIPCLLTLIYIGSSIAFEDIISLSVSGLYASYFIPCSLLLWRRVTGQIANHRRDGNNQEVYGEPPTKVPSSPSPADPNRDSEVVQPPLTWGPWRIPGALGTANNAFACAYILFVIFWSFWPPETPATPQNMNYSVLMTATVTGFSIVYYYLYGKKQYLGPLIEEEVRGMARARSA